MKQSFQRSHERITKAMTLQEIIVAAKRRGYTVVLTMYGWIPLSDWEPYGGYAKARFRFGRAPKRPGLPVTAIMEVAPVSETSIKSWPRGVWRIDRVAHSTGKGARDPSRGLDKNEKGGSRSKTTRARDYASRDRAPQGKSGNPRGLHIGDVVFVNSQPEIFGRIERFEYDHRYGGAEGVATLKVRRSYRSSSTITEHGVVASGFRPPGSSLAVPTRELVPLVRGGRETRERAIRDPRRGARSRRAT